jgi:hypothetical protein
MPSLKAMRASARHVQLQQVPSCVSMLGRDERPRSIGVGHRYARRLYRGHRHLTKSALS